MFASQKSIVVSFEMPDKPKENTLLLYQIMLFKLLKKASA